MSIVMSKLLPTLYLIHVTVNIVTLMSRPNIVGAHTRGVLLISRALLSRMHNWIPKHNVEYNR